MLGQIRDLLAADILVSGTIGLWLAMIAVIDLKSLRIPDYLSLPLVIVGLGVAWFDQNHGLPFTGILLMWTPTSDKDVLTKLRESGPTGEALARVFDNEEVPHLHHS